MRYLITFSCYGARLHGDEAGSVDREHHVPGSRLVAANAARAAFERKRMNQAAYLLDEKRREVVLGAIRSVCLWRGWTLLAAHARSTHVHVVVEGEDAPEKMMTDFKAYSSRELNGRGWDPADRRRWARHGSTRWLWKDEDVTAAMRYVVEGQGEAMAVFSGEAP